MTSRASLTDAVTQLAGTFSGQLLQPLDRGYDEARSVHNGLVEKRPALIARCRGVADIGDAVKLAREHGLEVSIRGGGHNVAGRAVVDGGLMIDLSLMKGIHVDPKARTARAQGGVLWTEFNRETQLHGLATTGGIVSTTGVAGLTLGGGVGWLMSKYGTAVDNLVSVELVTADGRLLTVTQQEHPDLFWAVRGAGHNFGVAASLEYRLHPVGPMITGGLLAHSFDKARDVLRFYRDLVASASDDLYLYGGLLHAPGGPPAPLVGLGVAHFGAARDAEAAVRPIKKFGSPVMDQIGFMSYCQLNAMLDVFYPRGIFYYWKAQFLAELSDDAIGAMIDSYDRCPARPTSQLFLEPFHGAVTRVPVDATPFPHRQKGHLLDILCQWTDAADTERCIAWTRETYATMKPFMAAARYVNYLAFDEDDAVAVSYGPNYGRLRELKTKYDPDNFFHVNPNIRPLS